MNMSLTNPINVNKNPKTDRNFIALVGASL